MQSRRANTKRSRGTDIENVHIWDRTALEARNVEHIRLSLAHGASVNHVADTRVDLGTPLAAIIGHHAAFFARAENLLLCITALLDAGADIDAVAKQSGCNDMTPLMSACYSSLSAVRLLLSEGADCCRWVQGESPMTIACRMDNAEVVISLLCAGSDPAYALRMGSENILPTLLSVGVGQGEPILGLKD